MWYRTKFIWATNPQIFTCFESCELGITEWCVGSPGNIWTCASWLFALSPLPSFYLCASIYFMSLNQIQPWDLCAILTLFASLRIPSCSLDKCSKMLKSKRDLKIWAVLLIVSWPVFFPPFCPHRYTGSSSLLLNNHMSSVSIKSLSSGEMTCSINSIYDRIWYAYRILNNFLPVKKFRKVRAAGSSREAGVKAPVCVIWIPKHQLIECSSDVCLFLF